MNESSGELLSQARSGDVHALELLIERHQAQVYRFGIKMCRDPDVAKDVLQDTLLAMARSVRGFRGGSSLSTWLYSIARSFCIKHQSRATRRADEPLDEAGLANAASLAPEPDDVVAAKQVEQALRSAVSALEPTSREVLILRDMEGLTAGEVAEVLGLSVDAVKSRLHRARLAVRAQVAPLLLVSQGDAPTSSCPDIGGLFSRYLEGEIDAAVCASMQSHIATCSHCRAMCDALKDTLDRCRSTAANLEVPAPVQTSVRSAMRDLLRGEPPSSLSVEER